MTTPTTTRLTAEQEQEMRERHSGAFRHDDVLTLLSELSALRAELAEARKRVERTRRDAEQADMDNAIAVACTDLAIAQVPFTTPTDAMVERARDVLISLFGASLQPTHADVRRALTAALQEPR